MHYLNEIIGVSKNIAEGKIVRLKLLIRAVLLWMIKDPDIKRN